jgi:hypothetical protein
MEDAVDRLMRLDAWSTMKRDVEFDPVTGAATMVTLPSPRLNTSVPAGFADFERQVLGARQVFALVKSGNTLFFSAGARRWELGQPGLRFVHGRPFPFLSRFRVIESDRVVFSILYSHVGRVLLKPIDPTYDKRDHESDVFVSFVAEYATSPEWQVQARERWASAVK